MTKYFELFWLRETGCDIGTWFPAFNMQNLEAAGLDPATGERLLLLAAEVHEASIRLQLPFMDQREWRRRSEVLAKTRFVREGNLIRGVPPHAGAALRDHAALLRATDPAWTGAPHEKQVRFFPVWQKVSVGLQKAFRQWIPEIYFRDSASFEDRDAAYSVIVYQASRVSFGRPRTEFTYDAADPESLKTSWNFTGRVLQDALTSIQLRLQQEGNPALARRYAPIWAEDIMRAVAERPRPFIEMVAQESAIINALIGMGTSQNMFAVKPFAKTARMSLRRMAGMDMRTLTQRVLDEATAILAAEAAAYSARKNLRLAS